MRLHLWKRSWTTLEETPNHSRCRAFHWHPVHNTYQIALMTARSEALGLPPRRVLFFVCLGRHFLSFLHRGRGRLKWSTLLVVVASFIRRISFENGDISESILGEMRLCSRAMKWFSDRLQDRDGGAGKGGAERDGCRAGDYGRVGRMESEHQKAQRSGVQRFVRRLRYRYHQPLERIPHTAGARQPRPVPQLSVSFRRR